LSADEPLAESAPLAHAWSQRHCDECDWYHGAWQYLRLVGVISGLTAESDFFQSVFRRLARSGRAKRILIAASADYGMLAQVIRAFQEVGETPRISVLDRCETPLRLNQWYARRFEIEPVLHRGDVFDFEPDAPYDVICTHSFFSFVAPERHAELARLWHGWLRPGGCVVTSQSVRPNYPTDRIGFTPRQAIEFGERAGRAIPVDAPIREIATRFAQKKTGFVVRDEQRLRRAFVDGGFELATFGPADAKSQRDHRAANPDDRDSWRRIQIVARAQVVARG